MAQRLKVFTTSDGFRDFVIATSSRAKALAAWGAHQDLFKTGGARQVDDPDLAAAALARPDEVLIRPANAKGWAELKARPKPAKPPEPSKADLRALERAEARLATLKARREAEVAQFAAERQALEDRARAAEDRHAAALEAAEQAVDEMRQRLER